LAQFKKIKINVDVYYFVQFSKNSCLKATFLSYHLKNNLSTTFFIKLFSSYFFVVVLATYINITSVNLLVNNFFKKNKSFLEKIPENFYFGYSSKL
ncbi:hypothetical protein CN497_22980, partial [Priestia megaterium]